MIKYTQLFQINSIVVVIALRTQRLPPRGSHASTSDIKQSFKRTIVVELLLSSILDHRHEVAIMCIKLFDLVINKHIAGTVRFCIS